MARGARQRRLGPGGVMSALAIRAMRCKGWRWMPGMLADGIRVIRVVDGHPVGVGSVIETGELFEVRMRGDVRPCLADHATLGCLLALVREAWDGADYGITTCAPMHPGDHWEAVGFADPNDGPTCCSAGESEAGALVAALEGAP